MAEEKCCPRLEAAEWDGKDIRWQQKPFYRTRYRTFLHIPLNFGGVVTRAMTQLEAQGLAEEQPMMLAKEESRFGSTLLISLKGGAGGLPTEYLSGRFLTRLFEGSYKQVGQWVQQTMQYCQEQGTPAQELLFWYVTCPKCAKKYGAAQTVVFARVE